LLFLSFVKYFHLGLLLLGFNVSWKGFALCFLVFLFFVVMSCLDFVIHRVLYDYGLQFSYGWVVLYWWVFGGVFLVFSVIIGFVYWLGSGKSQREFRIGFGLFLSLCLFFFGGLVDVLWFVFWDGGLPGNDVVWWWMPWASVFGFWNSTAQFSLLTVVFVVIMLFWIWILRS